MSRLIKPPFEDTLSGRIDARLFVLGLKEREASAMAGQSETLRNIRLGKSKRPNAEVMLAIAAVLQTTPDWLLNGSLADLDLPTIEPAPEAGGVPRPSSAERWTPVYSVVQGSPWSPDLPGVAFEEKPTEWVRSPPALEDVVGGYAFRIRGNSMEPVHPNGALRFAHPTRRPRPLDPVVIITRNRPGGPLQATLKILVRIKPDDAVIVAQTFPRGDEIEIPARHIVKGPHVVLDPEGMVQK